MGLDAFVTSEPPDRGRTIRGKNNQGTKGDGYDGGSLVQKRKEGSYPLAFLGKFVGQSGLPVLSLSLATGLPYFPQLDQLRQVGESRQHGYVNPTSRNTDPTTLVGSIPWEPRTDKPLPSESKDPFPGVPSAFRNQQYVPLRPTSNA